MSGRYLLPLRVNLAPLLQQWLKEREIFRAVITDPRYQFPRDESGGWRYTWWMHELFELQETQDASTTRLPAKVFLQVRRYEWRKDFSFSLYLVDEQNREIARGYYSSNEGWETEEERIARLSKQDNALVQPVEWRKETQQWLDAWRTALSKGAVKPFPEFLYQSRSQSSQKRVCPITPSLRFPLQAGGTEPTRPTRFPSRSGGNLQEGGNCKLCPCDW
jgi:hypothetical protein